jgi:hypothetical protein
VLLRLRVASIIDRRSIMSSSGGYVPSNKVFLNKKGAAGRYISNVSTFSNILLDDLLRNLTIL